MSLNSGKICVEIFATRGELFHLPKAHIAGAASRERHCWRPASPSAGVPRNGDRFHGILDVVSSGSPALCAAERVQTRSVDRVEGSTCQEH